MQFPSGITNPVTAASPGETGALVFSRSRSRSQGYHERPMHRDQSHAQSQANAVQEQGEGMVFSRSTSESQNIVTAQKEQEKSEDNGSKGPVWRLKNAFLKSENMISTYMTLGFIKGWTDKTFGAWGVPSPLDKVGSKLGTDRLKEHLPAVPGQKKLAELAYGKDFDKSQLTSASSTKPETFTQKALATAVTGALIQNVAFFMTARGGEIPDGDTMMQRAVNAVKHPDKHSVHFSNATISALIGVIGMCRTTMGIKGLAQNDPENTKKNVSMLVSGLCGLVATPLVFGGMFRMDKDEMAQKAKEQDSEAEKNASFEKGEEVFAAKRDGAAPEKHSATKGLISSLSPKHLGEMWKYALQNDKMGLVGRALTVAVEMGFVASGRADLQKDPTNEAAYKTVKGGLTGMALTFMQAHFVYDRLLTNSRSEGASR